MAAKHENLELGIIPTGDTEIAEDNINKECKNALDVCSESTPMNAQLINEDDPQHTATENIQPDSNATDSLHSEQGKMIFCIDLSYSGV